MYNPQENDDEVRMIEVLQAIVTLLTEYGCHLFIAMAIPTEAKMLLGAPITHAG